jgi:S1-C subfamily serine protease
MADVLKSLSDDLANVVEAASAGIVRVEGRKRLAATGFVWSADGLIITADHVLRSEGLRVGLPNGDVVEATVVGRDPSTDLAVVRTSASVQAIPRAATNPRVGHLVLAIGRPGDQVQATLGVVSAIGSGRMDGAIQTDVVMYPGFSGGPLINAAGEALGMNTSGFMRGASAAISNAMIAQVAESLVRHGRVRQGYLGVGAQPVRLPQAIAEQVGQETGLMLASIESGSPAEAAALYQGDIIISLDGHATPSLDDLIGLLTGDRVGSQVTLRIVRGGQVQDVGVTVGEKQ